MENKVKALREAKGFSKEELAVKSKSSYPMIVAIENGRRLPNLKLAGRLAKIFGVTIEQLELNGD